MSEINLNLLKDFREDFTKTVEDLGKKYGLRIKIGNIRYSAVEFTTTLTCTNDDVSPYAKYEQNFNSFHNMYGLQKEDLNKEFSIKGIQAKFVGLDMKKRSYPCIVVSLDGKTQWKLSVEQLKLRIK